MSQQQNTLFPVFLKLEKLNILLVGGGYVALEKLQAVYSNCPEANVRLVALQLSPQVKEFIASRSIKAEERPFEAADLEGVHLVIIAINDRSASKEIYLQCRARNILTNVADTPDLCDFYLSSVVQKGNLKVAVSTNGKSPTIAKRIKEMLNDTLPPQLDEILDNMEKIRGTITGDFTEKVKQLNELTSALATKKNT